MWRAGDRIEKGEAARGWRRERVDEENGQWPPDQHVARDLAGITGKANRR